VKPRTAVTGLFQKTWGRFFFPREGLPGVVVALLIPGHPGENLGVLPMFFLLPFGHESIDRKAIDFVFFRFRDAFS